jgi:hypothetical protein
MKIVKIEYFARNIRLNTCLSDQVSCALRCILNT